MECDFTNYEEKDHVAKDSTKPEEEESLESKLWSMITADFVFKDGSKKLDIHDVSVKNIYRIYHANIIVQTQEKFNYVFEGFVEIGIIAPNGVTYQCKNIKGYFQSEDDKTIDRIFNEIQIIS